MKKANDMGQKILLVALNKFVVLWKKNDKKENYMTVPAAIRELEKIEIIQQSDHRYRLNYAVTATQKEILKAFGINEINIKKWANEISDKLSEKMKEAV